MSGLPPSTDQLVKLDLFAVEIYKILQNKISPIDQKVQERNGNIATGTPLDMGRQETASSAKNLCDALWNTQYSFKSTASLLRELAGIKVLNIQGGLSDEDALDEEMELRIKSKLAR